MKVVTLITGDVRTQFWNNAQGAHVALADTSPYQPIKAKVEPMMQGKTNPPGGHSAQDWARAVVDDLLGVRPCLSSRRGVVAKMMWMLSWLFPIWLIQSAPPSYIHRGFLATTMSVVSWVTPSWVFDWAFMRTSDLTILKAKLNEESQQSKKDD